MKKNEIYIRTCGNEMTICLKTGNKYHYRDYSLDKLQEKEKDLIRNFMKLHATIPINIMWSDLQKIRKWGFRI